MLLQCYTIIKKRQSSNVGWMFDVYSALALAPLVAKGLSWFTAKFKFESQRKVNNTTAIPSFSDLQFLILARLVTQLNICRHLGLLWVSVLHWVSQCSLWSHSFGRKACSRKKQNTIQYFLKICRIHFKTSIVLLLKNNIHWFLNERIQGCLVPTSIQHQLNSFW